WDMGGRTNHFPVTRNPAVAGKVKERLEKLAAVTLPADLAAEGDKLLAKMPHLRADQELRKLYQKLSDGQLAAEEFTTARAKNFAERELDAKTAEAFARKTMDGLLVVRS